MDDHTEGSAVLLMDLQEDFLDETGRMPVDRLGAQAVIDTANAILSGKALPGTSPVLVVNQFPASARVGNLLRHGAAIVGSDGSRLDRRLVNHETARVFAKRRASAFSNPELLAHLRMHGVKRLFVLGVFAEGCVRATVLDAVREGFMTCVISDAIATNAQWKKRLALWSMKRAGAILLSL